MSGWQVKHKNGWCAGKGRRPSGGAVNWPTLCNHFVILPGHIETGHDLVDCPECLAISARKRASRSEIRKELGNE